MSDADSSQLFSVSCDDNIKSNITNIEILGIMINNTLTWKSHIEMIIPNFEDSHPWCVCQITNIKYV